MSTHHGMRPLDIVVLLKILSCDVGWTYGSLSSSLFVSVPAISASLERSAIVCLIDENKNRVFRPALMEFIQYGLRYVFPLQKGGVVKGIPTAHAHPVFQKRFVFEQTYVWAHPDGKTEGVSILPLCVNGVKAALYDDQLYKMLAAVDMIRGGRPREVKVAVDELQKTIL